MEPLFLRPTFKDYLWGGTKLKKDFNKQSELKKIAESWELACHKDGNSYIENGEFKGLSLDEYIQKNGKKVLGTNCEKFDNFPVLIKLIDAKDNLSVQVHPDNEYAMRVEGEYGKTEMWYIVDCEEGASLLYGFNHDITPQEFKRRIEENTLLEVTNSVEVHKGDVFFIKSGTLHAIGKGIVIAEIQQNSNTTYRIYDYGRVGADGKPRQLHIEKALEVTDLCPAQPYKIGDTITYDGYTSKELSCCEYFTVDFLDIENKADLIADEKSFNSLLILEGNGSLLANGKSYEIKKGNSVFIPAHFGEYKVTGNLQLILTKI